MKNTIVLIEGFTSVTNDLEFIDAAKILEELLIYMRVKEPSLCIKSGWTVICESSKQNLRFYIDSKYYFSDVKYSFYCFDFNGVSITHRNDGKVYVENSTFTTDELSGIGLPFRLDFFLDKIATIIQEHYPVKQSNIDNDKNTSTLDDSL